MFGAMLLLIVVLVLVTVPVHIRSTPAGPGGIQGGVADGELCGVYRSVGILGFGCIASATQVQEPGQKSQYLSEGIKLPLFSSFFEHIRAKARENAGH